MPNMRSHKLSSLHQLLKPLHYLTWLQTFEHYQYGLAEGKLPHLLLNYFKCMDEVNIFESVNMEKSSCNGRLCAKCGKCRDWYYIGDSTSLAWLQNWKNWSKSDWERYRDNEFSKDFKKRDDATCYFYFCILDGDIALSLHLHSLGADAYAHAHHDLCLCNENIRI
ncbi:unnamed protein product [Rotaria socialis]